MAKNTQFKFAVIIFKKRETELPFNFRLTIIK